MRRQNAFVAALAAGAVALSACASGAGQSGASQPGSGGAPSGAATSAHSGAAGQSGADAAASGISANEVGAQSSHAANGMASGDSVASGEGIKGGADVEAIVNIGYIPAGYSRADIDMPDRIAFLRPPKEDSGFVVFIPKAGSDVDKYSAEEFIRNNPTGKDMLPESIKAQQGTTVDGIPATAASALGLTPSGYMGLSVVKTTRSGRSVIIVAQAAGPDEASATIDEEEFSAFVKGVTWK